MNSYPHVLEKLMTLNAWYGSIADLEEATS